MELKVGDRVMTFKAFTNDSPDGNRCGWVHDKMPEYVGLTGIVLELYPETVLVEFADGETWSWLKRCVKPYDDTWLQFYENEVKNEI